MQDIELQKTSRIVFSKYGIKVSQLTPIYSYFGGVYELSTSDGKGYILKLLRNPSVSDMQHFEAVVAFADYVAKNISEFTTQKFIKDNEGQIVQVYDDKNYFYLVQKQEIIKKDELTEAEQLALGNLLRIFHEKLKSFKHQGIDNTEWMTSFSSEEQKILAAEFPSNEYEPYVEKIDYLKENLEVILIHGDLHQGNISFNETPFIFDLDTLCYGSRVEEIARTITHWRFKRSKLELFENLTKGYAILTKHELELLPQIMVRICYKKVCEFLDNDDRDNVDRYKVLATQLKEAFNLK